MDSSTGDLHEEIVSFPATREKDAFEDEDKMQEAVFAELGIPFNPITSLAEIHELFVFGLLGRGGEALALQLPSTIRVGLTPLQINEDKAP